MSSISIAPLSPSFYQASLDPTVRVLGAHASLSSVDHGALNEAFDGPELAAPGEVVFGDGAGGPFMIVSGLVALSRTGLESARQIISFFVSGDIVGLDTATMPRGPGAMIVVTTARIRRLAPGGRQRLASVPTLLRALAAQSLQHQAWLQDQIFRLGALSALGRTAHLLAELSLRLERAGFRGEAQPLPIKQEVLAEALGLSLVHVNRTLKRLRELRLAWFECGRLMIPDRAALLDAAVLG